MDLEGAVFDPVLFVFLNRPHNRVKILYWERNGFCPRLKHSSPNDSKHPLTIG
ncbi:IS66 family insertion sequence element accessory protein TnpB [Pseudomonas lini]